MGSQSSSCSSRFSKDSCRSKSYPSQSFQSQPQNVAAQQPYNPYEAPPPYSPVQQPIANQMPYTAATYPVNNMAPPMNNVYNQYAPAPHQATFVVPDAFDAGARFSAQAPMRIPPPPPGIAPNMAQIAAMNGHNVVIGQKQADFWNGRG